jgi:dephospho-CoA kinase
VRVGLTGGIGAGKSTVAGVWRERGALILDADEMSRVVVLPGTIGIRQIAARWPDYVDADEVLDRKGLSRVIFADDAQRAEINALIYPLVLACAIEREAAAPAGTIAVHVIPLLFEWDYWRMCDATVAVFAPEDVRVARVTARDGLSRDDVLARMRAQLDPVEMRARATYAIDNAGDLATLRARAEAVWLSLDCARDDHLAR